MKKSEALEKVKEGDVEAARFMLGYFERRLRWSPDSPSIYKYIRRHTGLSVVEWEALEKRARA